MKDKVKLLKKVHFQNSELIDFDYIQFSKTNLVERKKFITHGSDEGKSSAPIGNKLKTDA